jgi:hypothetical protein
VLGDGPDAVGALDAVQESLVEGYDDALGGLLKHVEVGQVHDPFEGRVPLGEGAGLAPETAQIGEPGAEVEAFAGG